MNRRLFRLLFSTRLGAFVPVSEHQPARGKGRGPAAGIGLLALLLAALVQANPTDPVVISGAASFSQSGNRLDISNSPNAIIHWGGFSIGQNEVTRFIQQSSASAVLNRVVGQDPSHILGQLQSNGRVFLINPNGIVFGAGSRIDTAGLIASSLNLGNEDFLAGRMKFSGSGGEGALRNAGNITTPSGGQVLLIAPSVENTGLITSPNGEVILAAGHTVELAETSNPALRVQITAPEGQALNLGTILAEGGRIGMVAGLVQQTGSLNASSAVAEGGRIFLKAGGALYSQGEVRADGGTAGGHIQLQADRLLHSGAISAKASAGTGGEIDIAAQRIIQTEGARVSVDASGAAGRIVVQASSAADGRLFSSATYSAQGEQGGEIHLLGREVVLLGAHADASGRSGGGTVLVGGDYRGGNPDVANSANTLINFSTTLAADARDAGDGGKVIVWSEQRSEFHGRITARGGAQAGDGGFIEVSGREGYLYAGAADAGAAHGAPGTLLIDPKNITIADSTALYGTVNLVDPHVGAGDAFGANVTRLDSGHLVVLEPSDDLGGEDAGAAYLFNGSTGALISTLSGARAGNEVGSGGITVLSNGSYLIASPSWASPQAEVSGGAGAVTWGSATLGVSGPVSATNSLVGSYLGDGVGRPAYGSSSFITTLDGGNFLLHSADWNGGRGAVTWGRGDGSVFGALSEANSLIGTVASDRVGSGGITPLGNGNYLVGSPDWNGGRGAVTWLDGSSGRSGEVGSTNSLVGSSVSDRVGSGGIEVLAGGHYLVRSPGWDNNLVAGASDAGAVTWGNGGTGRTGEVDSGNSLVGIHPDDLVGSGGITALGNGNYLVGSPDWNAGRGAVTWLDGSTGRSGEVGLANSLVGSSVSDRVGSGGIAPLANGNYLVLSPDWNDSRGAVTWNGGSAGVTGAVSTYNSLVGMTPGDAVGSGGNDSIIDLKNSYYLLRSPNWHYVSAANAGAVTWFSATAHTGQINASNSLVGSSANDAVGSGGIEVLAGGHYLVRSPGWDNYLVAGASDAGAVTWGNGGTGRTGEVGSGNSLVGTHLNDAVGSGGVDDVGGGTYLVRSPDWSGARGAVTWLAGSTGLVAEVTAGNSLVGSVAGDAVGSGGISTLDDNKYLVFSPDWSGGKGAVTWGDGANALTGPVGVDNSLVGTNAGDAVGSGGMVNLWNGHYLVRSPNWSGSKGAVTWDGGRGTIIGEVGSGNSLVGSSANDTVGSGGVVALGSGKYLVFSPLWDNAAAIDAGAVTWGNGATALTGPVAVGNSLVGSTSNDRVGSDGLVWLYSGNYLIRSPHWGNGAAAPDAGALTWFVPDDGPPLAPVSALNSLVGTHAGDQIGSGGVVTLNTGNYVVVSPNWDSDSTVDVGAVTWGNGTTGLFGAVTADNSLVGTHAGDQVGSGGVTPLYNGNYVVVSPNWDSDSTVNVGAVTWGDGITGLFGAVTDGNSLVGSSADDFVGNGGLFLFSNGNYLVTSRAWHNGGVADAGALTWVNGTTGLFGEVSADNSLVGSHSGDFLTDVAITELNYSNGNYLVSTTAWYSGRGAVTWGDGSAGVRGAITGANSFIGSTAADRIGSAGIVDLQNGSFLIRSPSADHGQVDSGRLDIFRPGGTPAPLANPLTFNNNQASDASLTPAQITAITNTGTSLVLQANNDITVNSAIVTENNGYGGHGGDLTLQAGRSILINADITTANGDLILIANETVYYGVVDAYRDTGAANIQVASNVTLNAGTGAVTVTITDSSDKTDNTSGSVLLESGARVRGGRITVSAVGGVIGETKTYSTTGILDTSAHDGPISLYAKNVLAYVNPGDGAVSVNSSLVDAGNSVYQTTGDLSLARYTLVGAAGSGFDLHALDGNVLIDRDINLSGLSLSLHAEAVGEAVGKVVRFVGNPSVTLARLTVEASALEVDTDSGTVNFTGVLDNIRAPLHMTGGRLNLDGASELYEVDSEHSILALLSNNTVFYGGVRLGEGSELILGSNVGYPPVPTAGLARIATGTTFNLLPGSVISGQGVLENRGTLNAGANSIGVTLNNVGTANLDSTTLAGFSNSGTLNLADAVTASAASELTGGTLNLGGQEAILTLDGVSLSWSGGTLAGAGVVNFVNGGGLVFTGNGARVLDAGNNTLTLTNATLPGGSLRLLSGGLTFNTGVGGRTNLDPGATLTIEGGTLTNNGDLLVNGQFNLQGGSYAGAGQISNASTGVTTLDAAVSIPGLFTNQGTLILRDSVTFQGGLTQESGLTDLDGGEIRGDFALNGGTLAGTGTVTGNLSIANNVTLSPGHSPGTLHVGGDLVLSPASLLLLEFAGTLPGDEYDLINVTGHASLDGTVMAALSGAYTPAGATTFTPIRAAGGVTGNFANRVLPSANYRLAYRDQAVDLVFEPNAATPAAVILALIRINTEPDWVGADTPQQATGDGYFFLPLPGGGAGTDWGALFSQLQDLANIQGWNDESRLVCQ